VAKCGIPLGPKTTLKEFTRRLQPLASARGRKVQEFPPRPTAGLVAKSEP
jgi:hypothetical protein